MEEFKEKINLLFVSNIGEFISSQEKRYIVKKFSDDEYFIKPEPAVFHGRLKDVFEDICYDYDTLPDNLKEKYKFNYQSFEKIEGNLYQITTKKYEISRRKKK